MNAEPERTAAPATTPHAPATGARRLMSGGPPGSARPPEEWPTGRIFSAVARRIEREWNAHLAHWDLNHASLPVLYLLAGGPRSQRELALASGVTEQTMSRVLARLERTGYVVRATHADDRRRHEVHLTATGRQALGESGDPQLAEAMSMRGLTEPEITQLRELLLSMLRQGAPAGHALSEILDEPAEGCVADEPAGTSG